MRMGDVVRGALGRASLGERKIRRGGGRAAANDEFHGELSLCCCTRGCSPLDAARVCIISIRNDEK